MHKLTDFKSALTLVGERYNYREAARSLLTRVSPSDRNHFFWMLLDAAADPDDDSNNVHDRDNAYDDDTSDNDALMTVCIFFVYCTILLTNSSKLQR